MSAGQDELVEVDDGSTSASERTPSSAGSPAQQQKVLLARWLVTEPKLLILDSRLGHRHRCQRDQKLVAELAQQGMAVVYISVPD